MRDFLLEHYKVINERLTHSDRNRDVWVGAYLVLMAGSLSFAFLNSSNSILNGISIKLGVLVFLYGLGVIVAIYVAIARGWHCEFSHAAIAISRALLDEDPDLLETARKFRKSSEFTHYVNIGGTEFWVFALVLSCLAFELFLVVQTWSYALSWPVWCKVLSCASSFWIGIPLYLWYLKRRENKFPGECYYSIPRRLGDSPPESTLDKKGAGR